MKPVFRKIIGGENQLVGRGLMPFEMRDLPSIVALTGPNGAGKSRLLDFIDMLAGHWQSINQEKDRYRGVYEDARAISEAGKQVDEQVDALVSLFKRQSYVELSQRKNPIIIRLNSYDTGLEPSFKARRHQIWEASKKSDKLLLSDRDGRNANLRIQGTVEAYIYATHPDSRLSTSEKNIAEDNYYKLKNYIKKFLSTELSHQRQGIAEIFGRALDDARLSRGQARLLKFCGSLFDRDPEQENFVLLIDEPETFLHAKAAIEMIEAIGEFLVNGQIFLATHSLPLLAHLGRRNIWSLKDGQVTYSGTRHVEVLESLCGGRDNISRLSDFLTEPAALAAVDFLVECLVPPSVVTYARNDEQLDQIMRALDVHSASLQRPIRILDWGAGKGRVPAMLADKMRLSESKTSDLVDYFAFDEYDTFADVCRQEIKSLHGNADGRYYSQFGDLSDRLFESKVDIVVLCNVLHEIPPVRWVKTANQISSLLSPDGTLLIIEDLEIPHGERAHLEGFVLLDSNGIRRLFRDSDRGDFVSARTSKDPRYQGRLWAYELKKSALERITLESVKDALKWTRDQSKRKIEDLRRKNSHSYSEGRLLSLNFAQFANSSLSLEYLGS